MRALCKYRGMLVVMEARPGSKDSRCPECGGKELREYQGWMECTGDCGFAVDKSSWERLRADDSHQRA